MAFDKYAYDKQYIKENYSRIVMEIPKSQKAQYVAEAKKHNQSITSFICDCVNKCIENDTEKIIKDPSEETLASIKPCNKQNNNIIHIHDNNGNVIIAEISNVIIKNDKPDN